MSKTWIATKNHVDDLGVYHKKREIYTGDDPPGLKDEKGKYLGHFRLKGSPEVEENKTVPGNPHAKLATPIEELTWNDLRAQCKTAGIRMEASDTKDDLVAKLKHKQAMSAMNNANLGSETALD